MSKVGRKRSDRRFRAPDGTVWASEYEYGTFAGLRGILGGDRVLKNDSGEGSTFDYTTKVASGFCVECGSNTVVQQRTYTPDILVIGAEGHRKTYIETKGYFSSEKRSLFGAFLKTGPALDIVLVLQANGKATAKKSMLEYSSSYFKIPTFVWNPKAKPTKADPFRAECPPELLEYLNK